MKNPTKQILDKAINLRLNGKGWKEVLNTTGLSHSQAERHEFRFKMWLQATGHPVEGDWSVIKHNGTDEDIAEKVATERRKGVAWGPIAERMSISESKARSQFAKGTGIKSQGLRVGHGGRFYDGNEKLYEAKRLEGTAIPARIKGSPTLNTDGSIKGLTAEDRARLDALFGATAAKAKATRKQTPKAKAEPKAEEVSES